jgi:hypothetical protein
VVAATVLRLEMDEDGGSDIVQVGVDMVDLYSS